MNFDMRVVDAAVVKALRQTERAVQTSVLDSALHAGARVLQKEVTARAPRGATRKLSTSIDRITRRRTASEVAVAVYIKRPVFWGGYNEFGTRKMRRQSFLRPALDARRGEVVRTVHDELKRRIGG